MIEDEKQTPDGAVRLVFQYGSNCLDSEINGAKRLRGDAKFFSIAETVEDYELAFNVFSRGRHCAAADIVRKPGSKVWGALYEIPEYLIARNGPKAHGRPTLDVIEGEGKNYQRQKITVRTPNGRTIEALTYTVREPRDGLKTNFEYVRYIVAGMRERGIPDDYIEKVKAIVRANNPEIAVEIERL